MEREKPYDYDDDESPELAELFASLDVGGDGRGEARPIPSSAPAQMTQGDAAQHIREGASSEVRAEAEEGGVSAGIDDMEADPRKGQKRGRDTPTQPEKRRKGSPKGGSFFYIPSRGTTKLNAKIQGGDLLGSFRWNDNVQKNLITPVENVVSKVAIPVASVVAPELAPAIGAVGAAKTVISKATGQST